MGSELMNIHNACCLQCTAWICMLHFTCIPKGIGCWQEPVPEMYSCLMDQSCVVLQLAEKGLQTYERDGWSEFDTQIVPERREVRPTADRGPILLCVDTSGSMRGARETVAKALALECMRAARAQASLAAG